MRIEGSLMILALVSHPIEQSLNLSWRSSSAQPMRQSSLMKSLSVLMVIDLVPAKRGPPEKAFAIAIASIVQYKPRRMRLTFDFGN